jgi:hypothetical protein
MMQAVHSTPRKTLSHRLDSFAEQRLSWLLPTAAIVMCVASAWQSSSTLFVTEPSPAKPRVVSTARTGKQISTLKPVVNLEHVQPSGSCSASDE